MISQINLWRDNKFLARIHILYSHSMRVKPANLCSIGTSASISDDDYNLF